nr:hypothetical protein [Methylobacterium sp. L1A1]
MANRNSAVEIFVTAVADPNEANIKNLKEHRAWREHLGHLSDEDLRLLARMIDRFVVLARLQPLQAEGPVAELLPTDAPVLNELAGRIMAQRVCR